MNRDRQERIFNFVKKHFSKYDFENLIKSDKNFKYDSYEHFIQMQKVYVDGYGNMMLNFLDGLSNLIESKSIKLCDKESMVCFSSDGFYFHLGKLVITNGE
jgi:hypothetical protein